MIVFVDIEHESGRRQPWAGQMLAARTRITYELEDVSGHPCHLVRYDRLSADLVERLAPAAVFLSGNSVAPDIYTAESLAALDALVAGGERPVFGFCGGWQLMARALGTAVVPLEAEADEPTREVGYEPIDLVADHPLLAGLGERPVMRHAHSYEVRDLPPGFVNLASTPRTEIQLAVDDERRHVGTQFHPEYATDEHPAGRRLIENFLHWSGVMET